MVINTIMAAVLGILSGLGIGGGSLLILWLTAVSGTDLSAAKEISLMFYIPCAAVSSLIRLKKRAIPLSVIWPAIVGGCISAAVFGTISNDLNVKILQKEYGFLLLTMGIHELWKVKKRRCE